MWPDLQEKVELELLQLRRLFAESEALLHRDASTPPDSTELRALGGILHDFYNGVENIFDRIDKGIDPQPKLSESWHKELLRQVAQPTEKRPAVISAGLEERLVVYLQFRHVFRHQYGFLLVWEQMAPLVQRLEETFRMLECELRAFFQRHS